MKKSTALLTFAILDIFFLLVAFAAGYAVRAVNEPDAEPPDWLPSRGAGDSYPLLAEVRTLLESRFIGTLPDDQTLEYGAVRGLVAAVSDPYTVFVEPQSHELDSNSLAGEYGGIGVNMSLNEADEVVLAPFPDSPAALAGVQEGDVLLAVDGGAIEAGASLDTVTALVRGTIGDTVRLTLRRPDGQVLDVDVVRQRVELPSVTWKMVDGQAAIGLIAISRFSDRTSAEVERAINELDGHGAQSYILDLRNNGGGLLDAAVDVSAHFLPGGVVMYETQRNAPEKTYSAPLIDGPAVEAPLAVLVNGSTASAAEIVAGALLDRDRAPLIGQPTYGKGSVQLVFDLSDGSSLHVTAYQWFTPGRRQLEAQGLPPTFLVEPVENTDAELAYAVQYLDSQATAPSARANEAVRP